MSHFSTFVAAAFTSVPTAIILALVIGASATFAWVTSRDAVANEFKNDGFGSASNGLVVTENQDEFDFEIGVPQAKEVSVLNTTASPMLVRLTFEEMINLLDSDSAYADYKWDVSPTLGGGYELVPFKASDVSSWTTITLATPITGITVKSPNPTAAAPHCAVIYTDGASKTWVAKFTAAPDYDPDTTTITGTPTVNYAYYKTGTKFYNTWNQKDNYAAGGWLQIAGGKTTIKPLASTIVSKIGKSSLAPTGTSYATAVAGEAAKIKFYYDALNAAAVGGNAEWFYNDADGYFYYMKVVAGGGSIEMLLKEVELGASAVAGMWDKYEYTLVVCVEGIQATKAALADATDLGTNSGWALTGTLLAQLEAAIDAYNA